MLSRNYQADEQNPVSFMQDFNYRTFANGNSILRKWTDTRDSVLHQTGSVWNLYEIGTDKPCVYTGPGKSTPDRFSYLLTNWIAYLYE